MADTPAVLTHGLTRTFGDVVAVDRVDLEVRTGEVMALLGPSGCGKTTMLRLLAGLERPDGGTITVAGDVVAGPDEWVPPERRHIGLVFQDYALFPHLSVERNIAYGLTGRSGRSDRAARGARVSEVLDLVGLAGYGDRHPHELSGGQQQRVALGRALAPEPAIVLLDEPFSNLDAAMRVTVRTEVREILTAAGATAIIVTHDQEEALSVADRVAVMRAGRLHQVAEPVDLYARPADPFVATFVGEADVLAGTSDGESIATVIGSLRPTAPLPAGSVDVVVRPETVKLRLDGSGRGTVRHATYFGHDQLVDVELPDLTTIRSRIGPGRAFEPGDRVSVSVVGDVLGFGTGPGTSPVPSTAPNPGDSESGGEGGRSD